MILSFFSFLNVFIYLLYTSFPQIRIYHNFLVSKIVGEKKEGYTSPVEVPHRKQEIPKSLLNKVKKEDNVTKKEGLHLLFFMCKKVGSKRG